MTNPKGDEIVETMARALFHDQDLDGDRWSDLASITQEDYRGYSRAAIAALSAAGYAIVPVEPNEAMLQACEREWDGRLSFRCTGAYKAMIRAASKEG